MSQPPQDEAQQGYFGQMPMYYLPDNTVMVNGQLVQPVMLQNQSNDGYFGQTVMTPPGFSQYPPPRPNQAILQPIHPAPLPPRPRPRPSNSYPRPQRPPGFPSQYPQPQYQSFNMNQMSQALPSPGIARNLFESTAMKCHELVAQMRASLKVHRTRDAWRLYKEIDKAIIQNSDLEHQRSLMDTNLVTSLNPINPPMPPNAQPKLQIALDAQVEKEAQQNNAEPITDAEEACIVAFLQACAFKPTNASGSVTGFGGRVFSYRDLSQVMHLLRDEKVVRAPGNAVEMEKILNRMLHLNLLPGTGDYTSLIATQGRLHNLPRALHHYRALLSLLAKGGAKPQKGKIQAMQPDIITLNTMIDVLGRNGDLPGSLRIAAEIETRGLQKTRSTYNVLIAVCGMNGDLWGAWRWFEEMIKLSGCLQDQSIDVSLEPNDITFSNLLDPLSRHSPTTFPLFLLIWSLMTTHPKFSTRGKVVPNAGHWNSALRALCRAGEWETAWRVYAAMCSQAGGNTGVNSSLPTGMTPRGGRTPMTGMTANQVKEMQSSAVAFQMAICPPELVKAAKEARGLETTPSTLQIPKDDKPKKKPDFKLGLEQESRSTGHLPPSLSDPTTYSRSSQGNPIPPPTSTTHTLFATHLSSLLGLHDLALRVLEAYGSSSGGPLPTAGINSPMYAPFSPKTPGSFPFPQITPSLHPNQQIMWGRDLYHARLGILVRKQDWDSVLSTWKTMCFGDKPGSNQVVGISHTTWRALLTALPPPEEEEESRSRSVSGSSQPDKHLQILPSQIPMTLLKDLVTMAEESNGASPPPIVLQALGINVDPFVRGRGNRSGQISGGSVGSQGRKRINFATPPNVPGPRALSPPPGKGFGTSSNISTHQLQSFVGGVTSQLGAGSVLDAVIGNSDSNGQMLPPMAPDEWDDTLDIPLLGHRTEKSSKKSLLSVPGDAQQSLLDYQQHLGILTTNFAEAGPETIKRAFSWGNGEDGIANYVGSLLEEL